MTLAYPHPQFVGFDRLFNELDRLTTTKPSVTYPPHNLIKVDDNVYMLEIAVAGYQRSDIEIEHRDNILTIRTKDDYKPADTEGVDVLHKGISTKKFQRKFTLSDRMEIKQAALDHGILSITLEERKLDKLNTKLIEIK